MADWYVSSVAYAAVPQWAATTTYAIGDIRRQLAAQSYANERCFRVSAITTGISGGSEPSWNRGNSATTTDGGVTWTECTGQSNHQQDNGVTNTWTAPCAFMEVLDSAQKSVTAAGDRIFVSSDHAEVISASGHTLLTSGTNVSPVKCVSVNRTTGNIPPISADITIGASISCSAATSTLTLGNNSSYWYGFSFSAGAAGATSSQIDLTNVETTGSWFFKDCTFTIVGTGATGGIQPQQNAQGAEVTLENPTFNFGSTSHGIRLNGSNRVNIRKGITFTGSIPTTLFVDGNAGGIKGSLFVNGCDLSSITGTLFSSTMTFRMARIQFANCKLNASVAVTTTAADANSLYPTQHPIELINCDSANTNYNNSWYHYQGVITTETTITRTNGATDGAQKVSHKVVTAATHGGITTPLRHFLYKENTTTGSSITLTVEIISSTTLNNNELWGEVEYLGDSASSKSSFADNTITDILTTATAQTASSATWDSSPSTPVTQKLQISVTPQKAGLIKFVVCVAKASTTLYIDPMITVS